MCKLLSIKSVGIGFLKIAAKYANNFFNDKTIDVDMIQYDFLNRNTALLYKQINKDIIIIFFYHLYERNQQKFEEKHISDIKKDRKHVFL